MTTIEFILSVVVLGMVVLQCVILIELRDQRIVRALRESDRREWIRKEHKS